MQLNEPPIRLKIFNDIFSHNHYIFFYSSIHKKGRRRKMNEKGSQDSGLRRRQMLPKLLVIEIYKPWHPFIISYGLREDQVWCMMEKKEGLLM